MSRRFFRCRNPSCPTPHGAVLGQLTSEGGLILVTEVAFLRCFLDTRRTMIGCPACRQEREFRGVFVALHPRMVDRKL